MNNTELKKTITQYYDDVVTDNLLKQALEIVHTKEYIIDIIYNCLIEKKDLDNDVVYTKRYFEATLKEINKIINSPQKLIVNIGLPTHHAFPDKASGFCIINTLVVCKAYKELLNKYNNDYIFDGFDINNDDGTKHCLYKTSQQSKNKTTHVDLFADDVFPGNGMQTTKVLFENDQVINENGYITYKTNNYDYIPCDLSAKQNKKMNSENIHPLVEFNIKKVESLVANAQKKLVCFFAIGFDSSKDETANCGIRSIVTGNILNKKERELSRFSHDDFAVLIEAICNLIIKYPKKIDQIIIQIEGGYNIKLVESSIALLHKTLSNTFPSNSKSILQSDDSLGKANKKPKMSTLINHTLLKETNQPNHLTIHEKDNIDNDDESKKDRKNIPSRTKK